MSHHIFLIVISHLFILIYVNTVCDTENVITAIRKIVPQKSNARTIDCAMDYCVIVWSIIFILFYKDIIWSMPDRGDLNARLYR